MARAKPGSYCRIQRAHHATRRVQRRHPTFLIQQLDIFIELDFLVKMLGTLRFHTSGTAASQASDEVCCAASSEQAIRHAYRLHDAGGLGSWKTLRRVNG